MPLWIQNTVIQGSRDQRPFDGYPELIAVFHALHRLPAPRHPPHALSSLAALIPPCEPEGYPSRPQRGNRRSSSSRPLSRWGGLLDKAIAGTGKRPMSAREDEVTILTQSQIALVIQSLQSTLRIRFGDGSLRSAPTVAVVQRLASHQVVKELPELGLLRSGPMRTWTGSQATS